MAKTWFRDPQALPFVPKLEPSRIQPPDPRLYEAMGFDQVRKLLRAFYEELAQSSIAGMFAEDRVRAADRSALFFTGVFGGPPLYAEKIGPPRMRARHLGFRIDQAARDEWLRCFYKTLEKPEDFAIPRELLPSLLAFLEGFSQWMVNTQEESAGPPQ